MVSTMCNNLTNMPNMIRSNTNPTEVYEAMRQSFKQQIEIIYKLEITITQH